MIYSWKDSLPSAIEKPINTWTGVTRTLSMGRVSTSPVTPEHKEALSGLTCWVTPKFSVKNKPVCWDPRLLRNTASFLPGGFSNQLEPRPHANLYLYQSPYAKSYLKCKHRQQCLAYNTGPQTYSYEKGQSPTHHNVGPHFSKSLDQMGIMVIFHLP